VFLVGTKK